MNEKGTHRYEHEVMWLKCKWASSMVYICISNNYSSSDNEVVSSVSMSSPDSEEESAFSSISISLFLSDMFFRWSG